MDIRIHPYSPRGTVKAVLSKSDMHRKLVCAALGDRPVLLPPNGISEDISATVRGLCALGACISDGVVTPITAPDGIPRIDCGESGATFRFLLPVAAAKYPRVHFTGRAQLAARPHLPLIAAMEGHGVRFSAATLPFETKGMLESGTFLLPGDVSSQFISGLMFALPLLRGDSVIEVTSPLGSAGYVDMTIGTLREFGIEITKQDDKYLIPGGQRYRTPDNLTVDGDWSAAAAILCTGATAGEAVVTGLDINSLQPDGGVLKFLDMMGARTGIRDCAVFAATGVPRGCEIDIDGTPDLFPALAALAAGNRGAETVFYNIGRLRYKESDRVSAVCGMLAALGVPCVEEENRVTVRGGRIRGGTVSAAGDHRIVMAAAILATGAEGPVTIAGCEAVNKSYPGFFEDITRLGGEVHVI